MATPVRIKRSTGSSAPSSLLNAELAYAEGGDGVLYIGVGSGGANGTATSVVQIAGAAVASTITTPRAPGVVFAGPASGSNAAAAFRSLVATDIPDISGTYLTTSSASSSYLTITNASSTYAPLASPTLTGVPLAPTAANGTATNQVATTAFVGTAIDNLVGSNVSAALDTLKELGDAIGSDANFAGTVTTALGNRLVTTNNLNDVSNVTLARSNLGLAIGTDVQGYDATLAALAGVTVASDTLVYATGSDQFGVTNFSSFGRSLVDDADASAARSTLGLGSMATQSSSNVSITGGSIDGITIDCGTF